jgi:acyl-CoA synthetase (AMP-forming)/AMP-acid ligase II/aryl carrier-like protein
MYGITETTVHVTYRPLEPGDTQRIGSGGSPVGQRIPDLRVYVLDAHLQPVPIDVVGELYVGGGGVARGYLNHPALTAERFIADPFSGDAGSRLYRTGDLARYRPDGSLEYLGRKDLQVKVRGFRIELGEIEAWLRRYPSVQDAAVLAREDSPGDQRLVAYYTVKAEGTAASATALDAEMLRTHLLRTLPEYMAPAAYVRMDALPLNSNGKLDRKALPEPGGAVYATRTYEAPVGEIEIAIARIWTHLLDVERVGRHDDFFSLGGHSLLAANLVERMRQEGLQTDIRTLFTASTLSALALGTREIQEIVL